MRVIQVAVVCIFCGIGGLLPITACAGDKAAPRRTVYAWFPMDFSNFDTRAIDWSAITHLSFRSVEIQPDGTVKEPQSREKVKKLVDEAHAHGVKVSVLVWGTDSNGSSKYLAQNADRAVQSLLEYVKANNLDALDMDDETWREKNSVTGGSNRELVTDFFRKLNKAYKAARQDYQIFWASPPVINAKGRGDAWPDYKAIADLIDGFCIMSYCMFALTAGWTGSAQPVEGGGKVSDHARDYATCVQDYLDATGGRKEKLLLGIANGRGGVEWKVRSDQPLAGIYPLIAKPRAIAADEARANAQKHGRKFDPKQKAPWYCYKEGDHFVQGWYEDDESLAAKMKLAADKDLGGICIWVLDGAKEPPETFKLIRRHLHEKAE